MSNNTVAPRKRRSSANWSSKSTTPTSTPLTNFLSLFAQPTPCPPPPTRSYPTRTTCSCAVRKSAPAHNVSTTRRSWHRRCASTTRRSTPKLRAPRTTSTASSLDARRMREVALGWSALCSSGWVCRTFACVVCSPGIRRGLRRRQFCRTDQPPATRRERLEDGRIRWTVLSGRFEKFVVFATMRVWTIIFIAHV
jgi:hypothetical protein